MNGSVYHGSRYTESQHLVWLKLQSKYANPGVWPGTLQHGAESVERGKGGSQTGGVRAGLQFAARDWENGVTIDVARRHAAEPVRRIGNFFVVFEQSEDVRDSRPHVVNMMRARDPLGRLL